jgi:hypothetical protein
LAIRYGDAEQRDVAAEGLGFQVVQLRSFFLQLLRQANVPSRLKYPDRLTGLQVVSIYHLIPAVLK